jgi:hypothetical protein
MQQTSIFRRNFLDCIFQPGIIRDFSLFDSSEINMMVRTNYQTWSKALRRFVMPARALDAAHG